MDVNLGYINGISTTSTNLNWWFFGISEALVGQSNPSDTVKFFHIRGGFFPEVFLIFCWRLLASMISKVVFFETEVGCVSHIYAYSKRHIHVTLQSWSKRKGAFQGFFKIQIWGLGYSNSRNLSTPTYPEDPYMVYLPTFS